MSRARVWRRFPKRIAWVRLAPGLAFAGLTLIVAAGKGLLPGGGERASAGERAARAPACAQVCEEFERCLLSHFGDTPENRAKLPEFSAGCVSGCAKREFVLDCRRAHPEDCREFTFCVMSRAGMQ